MGRSLGLVGIALGLAVGFGCSSDSNNDNPEPNNTTVTGDGDSTVTGDGDTTPISPPADPNMMMQMMQPALCDDTYMAATECGGTACPDPGLLAAGCVRPCCTENQCGTLLAFNGMAPTTCTLPAEDDTDCPAVEFMDPNTGMPASIGGCCAEATNLCGLNVFGICIDVNSALRMFGFAGMGMMPAGGGDAGVDGGVVGADGGMMMMGLPEPTDCDGNPVQL